MCCLDDGTGGTAGAIVSQLTLPGLMNMCTDVANMGALSEVAGVLGAALITGSSSSAQAGQTTASLEFQYNYLSHDEVLLREKLEKLLSTCTPATSFTCNSLRNNLHALNQRDAARDAELASSCNTNPGSPACQRNRQMANAAYASLNPGSQTGDIRQAVVQEQQETARLLASTPTGTIGPIKPNTNTGDIFLDQQVPSMQIGMAMIPLVVAAPYATAAAEGLAPYVGGKTIAGGLIGGGTDAVGQYAQNGEVRLGQTVFATITGAVVVPISNGNIWVDSLLGAVNGAANVGFQNVQYGDNNSLYGAAGIGAIAGGVGNWSAGYVMRNSAPTIRLNFNPAVPINLQPMVMPNIWREPAAQTANAIIGGIPAFIPTPQAKPTKIEQKL